MIKRIINEPLIHFLIAALAIFALYSLTGSGGSESSTVLINKNQFAERWQRAWRRPPTEQELRGMIDEYLNDEVLYREALRLGLDREDAVVRNRMLQKMKFLQDQRVPPAAEADLQNWLDENEATYQQAATMTLKQIYLGQQAAQQSIAKFAGKAINDQALSALDDGLLGIANRFENISTTELAGKFGLEFANSVDTLAAGSWQGPITSGYGQHMVFVVARTTVASPDLSNPTIKQRVENDWLNAQQQRLRAQQVQELRENFTVEFVE